MQDGIELDISKFVLELFQLLGFSDFLWGRIPREYHCWETTEILVICPGLNLNEFHLIACGCMFHATL